VFHHSELVKNYLEDTLPERFIFFPVVVGLSVVFILQKKNVRRIQIFSPLFLNYLKEKINFRKLPTI